MKNILYTLVGMMTFCAFTGCSPEVDDVFNMSASQRIEEAIANDLSVLRGAENGWVMQYYPSSTRTYGGYILLLSFADDGTARVSCDLFAKDKVATSQYEVKQSMGAMLTFDTYNEVFHFFSNPKHDWGWGENGYGMEGDYEFSILECTPEKVVLQGKKTGNEMVMTPVPAGTSWEDYLASVKTVAAEAYPAVYDVYMGSSLKYNITQKHHKFVLENADGSSRDLPFAYTPHGIRFYEPVSIGTQKVQDMAWDKAQQAYTSGDIRFKAQQLPAGYYSYQDFVGSYVMVYGNDEQRDVTIEEEAFNESFLIKGFAYDIRLFYDAAMGTVTLSSQQLDGNIYLCAWSLGNEGKLTIASGAGMTGYMQKSTSGRSIIVFEDNGMWNYTTDSFVVFDIVNGESIFQIAYLQGLVKR